MPAGAATASLSATRLSLALYTAHNRMVRLHRPILEPLDLTFPQYLVLVELFASHPRTVGELGARVGMDAGTITPLLKRLEAAGKVSRVRDPQDERRVMVDLTPQGESLRHIVLKVSDQVESACELPELELERLRKTLDRLAHSKE